jgi:hypothetical protein
MNRISGNVELSIFLVDVTRIVICNFFLNYLKKVNILKEVELSIHGSKC